MTSTALSRKRRLLLLAAWLAYRCAPQRGFAMPSPSTVFPEAAPSEGPKWKPPDGPGDIETVSVQCLPSKILADHSIGTAQMLALRGILGGSVYAKTLRKQVLQCSREERSVIIFGEPGTKKDMLAFNIHFARRKGRLLFVDCGGVSSFGARIWGRQGAPGLLDVADEGTLVFNNVHQLNRRLLPAVVQLATNGTYWSRNAKQMQRSKLKVILISEEQTGLADIPKEAAFRIKVPALRVRREDIESIVRYELRRLGRTEGRAIPDITPEALKRLQAYDFPNNVQELFGLIENACRNLPENAEALTAELLWTAQSAQKLDLFKVNLLDVYPGLRDFLRSDWLENLNHGFTKYVFAVLVVLLFVGPQTRDANVGLSVFWAWWWPGILLTYPLLGRFWCAVCPFMIYGEVVQRWRVASGAVLQKWPAEVGRNGGWFLFVLFLGILLWEELWVLENTAYLSSCLLLLITFGAMVGSYFFERRIWCRHLCPIGGMNGLYAKLSLTELRAQNGQCKAVCNTFHCYKGGPEEGEGQETDGCPLYSHPANLKDNKDCVLCFTCLKACPHRNVMLSLRAPGVDFGFPFLFPIPGTAASARHEASAPEVALLFLLLGAVFCHHLPELSAQLGAPELVASFSSHALLATAALLGPGLLVLCADRAARLLSSAVEPKRRPLNDFVELAYSYLPLTWLASLAHWLELGMTEAGLLLPTAARTATFFVPAVGDAVDPAALPTLVFAPAAVALVQGALLLAAAGFSLQLYSKLGSKDAPFAWVHQLMILALTWELWQLIL
ncbi:unnamed protein product [Effrenium voratum]|uniref:4Fe-4S binding protein n=1 Tax=Effrenium voratum TaxID=2562239 RepID=A0AA36HTZ5_9DINO|nr:unnamed protein product [Effrenium voratum]